MAASKPTFQLSKSINSVSCNLIYIRDLNSSLGCSHLVYSAFPCHTDLEDDSIYYSEFERALMSFLTPAKSVALPIDTLINEAILRYISNGISN